MDQPGNAAAEQVVRARSVLVDLDAQAAEIEAAKARQQEIIDAFDPVAEWVPSEPDPLPEIDPDPAE